MLYKWGIWLQWWQWSLVLLLPLCCFFLTEAYGLSGINLKDLSVDEQTGYLIITELLSFSVHLGPSLADNPPCDLHFWDSVPVLVVSLVFSLFVCWFGLVVDSCELVVISVHVLIFFFLDKSL